MADILHLRPLMWGVEGSRNAAEKYEMPRNLGGRVP